jgi:hypothetical protein
MSIIMKSYLVLQNIPGFFTCFSSKLVFRIKKREKPEFCMNFLTYRRNTVVGVYYSNNLEIFIKMEISGGREYSA